MDHNVQFTDIEETTTAMADAAILVACRKAAKTGVKEIMKKIEKALLAEIDLATSDVGTDLDEAVFITRCILAEAATRFGTALKDVGDAGREIYEETYCQCDAASPACTLRPDVAPAAAIPPPIASHQSAVPLAGNGAPPPPFRPPTIPDKHAAAGAIDSGRANIRSAGPVPDSNPFAPAGASPVSTGTSAPNITDTTGDEGHGGSAIPRMIVNATGAPPDDAPMKASRRDKRNVYADHPMRLMNPLTGEWSPPSGMPREV